MRAARKDRIETEIALFLRALIQGGFAGFIVGGLFAVIIGGISAFAHISPALIGKPVWIASVFFGFVSCYRNIVEEHVRRP